MDWDVALKKFPHEELQLKLSTIEKIVSLQEKYQKLTTPQPPTPEKLYSQSPSQRQQPLPRKAPTPQPQPQAPQPFQAPHSRPQSHHEPQPFIREFDAEKPATEMKTDISYPRRNPTRHGCFFFG